MRLQGYADSNWAGSAVDRKIPQGAASILDLPWFPGVARNKLSSILQYVCQYVKQCGFESSLQDFFIRYWIPP
jgi:hypothetical protein